MARVSENYYEMKKQEIVDATIRVCKQKTVSSITMQDIINATGMSQGAIYRYYKNIDEILTDLLSRIRMEQYESIDRLNSVLIEETEKMNELRAMPIDEYSIRLRREKIADVIRKLYKILGEEIEHFLYPHRKIQAEFTILADNYPDRARVIFVNAKPERSIDTRIIEELQREIEDGIITPRISLEEFKEYYSSMYVGIIRRAISVNCYRRNKYFDDSNNYDIQKRYETFAMASEFFLGL